MGRGAPRWSVVSVVPQPLAPLGMASMAGLSKPGNWVKVGPLDQGGQTTHATAMAGQGVGEDELWA